MHSLCKNSFLSTALAASLSLSAACGGGQADGPVEPTTPGVSSARVGDPSSKPVVVLNDYTANTVWGSLPLFGRAPADARLVYSSPLVGTQILTVDGDGHLDILAAGNNFSAEVETVRYDGGRGLVILGDGEGNFDSLSPIQSGFFANSDVKDIKSIGNYILVASNDSKVFFFKR